MGSGIGKEDSQIRPRPVSLLLLYCISTFHLWAIRFHFVCGKFNQVKECQVLKRESNDIGWESRASVDPTNLGRVLCKLCERKLVEGLIGWNNKANWGKHFACPKSTKEDQAKYIKAIIGARDEKKEKKKEDKEIREEVDTLDEQRSGEMLKSKSYMKKILDQRWHELEGRWGIWVRVRWRPCFRGIWKRKGRY